MRIPPPPIGWYEQQAWAANNLVCGLDEVGRGCLAGPLVTAAVVLPPHCDYPLKDSKKISEKAREQAYAWLVRHAQYAIAHADHAMILEHNIYQATLRAMRHACLLLHAKHASLFARVQTVVVDAMPLVLPASLAAIPVASFIKGEDHSPSIAAASIIAKVTRDRLMRRMQPLFPRYHFAKDKAYATATHSALLTTHAATLIHRAGFVRTLRANAALKETV